MKLSLSNIAWSPDENAAVIDIMHNNGITGVDFALSKIFAEPLTATDADIQAVIDYWTQNNIAIAGAQSIHFGFPQHQLFGSPTVRAEMIAFTNAMVAVAGKLGVSAVVFGSPKNRVRGDLPLEEATTIAIDAFRQMGESAVQHNTCIVIEPNAAAYGCDFIRTAEEGIAFVTAVNHPGVKLHLDTGSMIMMNDDIPAVIRKSGALLKHFHVAAPELSQVGLPETTDIHMSAAEALRDINYTGWVTVEMKDGLTTRNTIAVTQAAEFVSHIYQ